MVIVVVIDSVAGISMLVNFMCNVKLWEITITMGDSSNSCKGVDGSVVSQRCSLPLRASACLQSSPRSLSPLLCKGRGHVYPSHW